MAKVKITFSGDLSSIGKVVELPDDEAVVLVREGRAVPVEDEPAKTKPAKAPKTS